MPRSFYYVLLLLCGLPGLLRAGPVRFQQPDQDYDLFQGSTLLEVPAGQVSIQDLLTQPGRYRFEPTRNDRIQPFRQDLAYWLRFELTNDTPEPIFLHSVFSGTGRIIIYEVADGRVLATHRLGTLEPQPTFPFLKSNQVCPTELRRGQTHLFYVFMQGIVTTALPLYARSTNNLLQHLHRADLFYGLIYGFILIVMVYSLLLYVRLREGDLLRYTIWVFFVGLQLALFRGHMSEFVWPTTPSADTYGSVLSGLTGLFHIPFTLAFLQLRQRGPILFRVGVGILIMYAMGIAINLLSISLTGSRMVDVVPLIALVEGAFSIWAGIVVRNRGFRPALFYVVGNVAFFASIVVFLFYATGRLPYSFWAYNSLHLGSAVEILLFTLALNYKVNLLKEQQEEAGRDRLRLVEMNRQLVEQQNVVLEENVRQRTDELHQQTQALQHTLDTLRATQAQLVQQEKLASLGELTAGIAHEIQNPLNFVNNFAEVSVELADELRESVEQSDQPTALALTTDVRENLARIVDSGRRASSIVRSMLEHARTDSAPRQPTDLNALADEFLRLSYQGVRAKDKRESGGRFTCQLVTDFDSSLGRVELVTPEIGRVLLNLFNNAFYAVGQQRQRHPTGYEPTVGVRTERLAGRVRLTVWDNGTGISEAIQAKIFQPFFTTKPTGQGTGLGLSLSYDIVTLGHGGQLTVASQPGSGTQFHLFLPLSR